MPKLGVADCADTNKTPMIATMSGGISQPKPYCLNWKCQGRQCRMKKAEMYLGAEWIRELKYIGWIPEREWETVKKRRTRKRAHSIIITFYVGDRLMASNKKLSEFQATRSNVKVLERLREQLVYGDVLRVTPAPPKVSKGGKLIAAVPPMEGYQAADQTGFMLKDGEIGDGYYERPEGDRWSQEETLTIVKGSLNTADFERIENELYQPTTP